MISKRWVGGLVIAAALLLLSSGRAKADVVSTFVDDLSGWQTATNGINTVDFELGRNLKYGSYEIFSTLAGLDLQATGSAPNQTINFSGLYTDGGGTTKYEMYVINTPPGDSSYWNSGNMLKGPAYRPGQAAPIRVKLPAAGVTSVGVDLRTVDDVAQAFSIVLYAGLTPTAFYTSPSISTQDPGASYYHNFWGATSDTPITRMDIILLGNIGSTTSPIIDNFRIGTIAGVPDPVGEAPESATVYLTLAGLGLIASSRRWKFSL
jgi:hypothetical protein